MPARRPGRCEKTFSWRQNQLKSSRDDARPICPSSCARAYRLRWEAYPLSAEGRQNGLLSAAARRTDMARTIRWQHQHATGDCRELFALPFRRDHALRRLRKVRHVGKGGNGI